MVNRSIGAAKFNAAGAFQFDFATDRAEKIAVDTSSGDVYVTEGGYIAQYDSAGNLLGRFGYEHSDAGFNGVGFNEATGSVYAIVQQPNFSKPSEVAVFGPPETVTVPEAVSVDPTDNVGFFDATFHGVVNPQGVPTSFHFEYRRHADSFGFWSSTAEQSAGSGTGPIAASTSAAGLTHKTTYDVRLVATNTDADASVISSGIDTFTTLTVPAVEAASIDAPTAVTATSAHLSGSLTLPPPGFSTNYRFQYSTAGGGGNGPEGSAGSGTGEVGVSGDLTGLVPNTEYLVWLTGSNIGGEATSSVKSFTTAAAPPSQVETIPAGAIESTSVRLAGFVNPSHSPTDYWFEYGPEDCASSSCASIPANQDGAAGSGSEALVVYEELGGLEVNTTYHYRIVAHNSAGTVAGNDITFTTDDPNAPGPPERGIELANAPDKGNQPPNGGLTADGEHLFWSTLTGVPGSPTGAVAVFRASRASGGWQSQSILPPLDQLVGGGTKVYSPRNVSGDGSRYVATVTYDFENTPEYVLVDSENHTQQYLGYSGATEADGGEIFADPDVTQAYELTLQQLSATDSDKELDLYAFDASIEDWEQVGLRSDGSDPACPISIPEILNESPLGLVGQTQIYFATTPSDNCGEHEQLYLRNEADDTTSLISAPAVGGGPLGEPRVVSGSSDGQAVLYTTDTKLSGTDQNTKSDLYIWRVGEGNECVTCVAPEANPIKAMASADLSYVYFVSQQLLAPGRGVARPAGTESLYVVHDGEIHYIAPVDQEGFGESTRYFTPSKDGSAVVLTTLLPAISADSASNGINKEIYRYDAVADQLECLSCPPEGVEAIGAFVLLRAGGAAPPQPLDASGEDVVFETPNPLVAEDANAGADIYEWRDGKVQLISDGVTEFGTDLGLGGISPDGTNVLLRTQEPLTGYELDHQPNFYVARIGGGFPRPPQPPAPCNEDACQGPLQTPPGLRAAGSSAYSGPGNQAPAVKKRHRKRHHHKSKRAHRGQQRNVKHSDKGRG